MEKNNIMQTLQKFFNGFDNLDGEMVKEAFHSNAFFYDTTEEGAKGVPIETICNNFLPFIKNHPEHIFNKEKCKKEVVLLDITGDAAVAKVEWRFSKLTMTDYYTLLKINGTWYIMNKVWHTKFHE